MSIVQQTTFPGALRSANRRLAALERSGSVWTFVGTLGLDGVDALLTPDSPPFENGWTNALGDQSPVSFTILNGWAHIRGGFFGGGDATTIFTLPIGYRPEFAQPMLISTIDPTHFATAVVNADGTVVFGTTV